MANQRTSLPDIPLTPRERDILEQSQTKSMRTSHSTESILRDSSPPPKPPLPHRCVQRETSSGAMNFAQTISVTCHCGCHCRLSNPPPLPPKRKSQHSKSTSGSSTSSAIQNHSQQTPSVDIDGISDSTLLGCGLDRMSLRSKSPDDNSSLLSTSSLDSALNHSREEDELKALTTDSYNCDEHTLKEDIDKFFAHSK